MTPEVSGSLLGTPVTRVIVVWGLFLLEVVVPRNRSGVFTKKKCAFWGMWREARFFFSETPTATSEKMQVLYSSKMPWHTCIYKDHPTCCWDKFLKRATVMQKPELKRALIFVLDSVCISIV